MVNALAQRRDGLHGVTSWALAVILGTSLAALVALGAASRPSNLTQPRTTTEPAVLSYEIDSLFRSAHQPPNLRAPRRRRRSASSFALHQPIAVACHPLELRSVDFNEAAPVGRDGAPAARSLLIVSVTVVLRTPSTGKRLVRHRNAVVKLQEPPRHAAVDPMQRVALRRRAMKAVALAELTPFASPCADLSLQRHIPAIGTPMERRIVLNDGEIAPEPRP
jgi:hypothetical protein